MTDPTSPKSLFAVDDKSVMSTEWIDRIHDGRAVIMHTAVDLQNLAHAFGRTGNRTVSADLFDMAKRLEHAADLIRDGAAKVAHQTLAMSTQASDNMMRALFAGIEVGKRPE